MSFFSASTETLISFCKEQGFLPAVTAVLHTFGSDLKRHVHVHIISAGGLKLSGKTERYTRFEQRKQRNPKARTKKVSVLTSNPEWIPWTKLGLVSLTLHFGIKTKKKGSYQEPVLG